MHACLAGETILLLLGGEVTSLPASVFCLPGGLGVVGDLGVDLAGDDTVLTWDRSVSTETDPSAFRGSAHSFSCVTWGRERDIVHACLTMETLLLLLGAVMPACRAGRALCTERIS